MPPLSPTQARLRRRRDFCAFVELYRDEHGATIGEAIAFISGHQPSPFPSLKAYERFMARERGEVGERMREILTEYENQHSGPGISREGLDSADLDACSEAERQQLRQDNWEFLCRTKRNIESNKKLLDEVIWFYIERKIVPALATT